jgi:O-methyltransferase involved in polyketide biosynthesis
VGAGKIQSENPSIFNDTKAIELVDQLDYDFARLDKNLGALGNFMLAAIAQRIDEKTLTYVTQHPKAWSLILGRA